jgi:hypothetical protein
MGLKGPTKEMITRSGFELRARGRRENWKRNGKKRNRNRSSVHPIWSRAPGRLFMQMVGIRGTKDKARH